jgi:hypothetical protein
MLAQRNQASIGAGLSYSVGIKGGGDAEAAADGVLVPAYDDEVPDMLKIALHHSRHTGTGHGQHTINPSSGLIIDQWVAP